MALKAQFQPTARLNHRSHEPSLSLRAACSTCRVSRRPLAVHAVYSTTTNPAFTYGLSNAQDAVSESRGSRSMQLMTVDGTVQKTSLLLGVAVLGAAYTWMQVFSGNAGAALAAISTGKMAGMVGLAAALATMFKPQWSPTTSLVFAVSKGLAVGAMSSIMELRYPGIVISATMLVLGTAASLLAAYSTRLLTVSDNFRNGVTMVTGGYMFVLLGTWLLSLAGVSMPSMFAGGAMGIGISLVAAALAAANLLLDFDMIKQLSRQRLPKWMEYYGAFSLMVTLIWMFQTALRLLGMMAGRRDD